MKIKKSLIIALSLLFIFTIPVFAQEKADSTSNGTFLTYWRIKVVPASLNYVIKRSDKPKEICDANELIAAGFNINITQTKQKILAAIIGMSFYSQDKKTYPILHAGIELLGVLQLQGGFDLGLVDNNIQSEWEKRAVILIGCDLIRIAKSIK